MFLIKRNGNKETFNYTKLYNRINNLCYNLNKTYINVNYVTERVIEGIFNGIQTSEIDILSSEICASLVNFHYDYSLLAARIAVSKLHKETKSSFYDAMNLCRNSMSQKFVESINKYSYSLDLNIKHNRDYHLNYFGLKTLEKSYLLKIDNKIVERPQYMFMRVAIEIHNDNRVKVLQTYNLMSQKYFIHSSPTLFNAGTLKSQLCSCFLMTMKGVTIKNIFKTLENCAIISQHSGGIGIAVHDISPLIGMLRVYNNAALYVEQGDYKRPGAFTIYLEPWHVDIFEFLNLKKNNGIEEFRARDLFYALWIPDLFMERVANNSTWSLMDPKESINLSKCWGNEFNKLYIQYESENKFKKQISARQLWKAIIESQIETGNPFMLYKDICNRKSNHQHLGTIQCSNLCTEILQYSSPTEIAVCNLASIALNKFVSNETFDFEKLKQVTKVITYNLNRIIDHNFYPLSEANYCNMKQRPIGIGVQGLADVFFLMKYPFDSKQARELNILIFETIYYSALEASSNLAKIYGHCECYMDSPTSKGILQYDMWNTKPKSTWDWSSLKNNIKKYGLRNSLVTAVMPTASTAQILGNNESIEPFTNNIFTRRVLSGEFQIINKYLIKDLIDKNLWNENLKEKIIFNNGSIQNIKEIPDNIKLLYRTVWEIPQKSLIDMAVDRGPFVDQSQSLNIYMEKPTFAKLSSMHFYAWTKGLKTGMYYLRTRAAVNPIQFTLNKDCLSCSS